MPGVPRDTTRRIGLLGGSFNPAHDGHRHISLEALKRLGLDEVWWLVSPQNPLKAGDGMEPLATRVARAKQIAHHPRIRVEAPELLLGTRYTLDTVRALQPALSQGAVRLADGRRHPAPARRLAGLARAVRRHPDRRLRPAGLELRGPGLGSPARLRALPDRRRPGAHACLLPAAGLVLHPEPARQPFRHGDPRRAAATDQAERKDHLRPVSSERGRQLPDRSKDTDALLALVRHSLDDDKAEDVVVIDLKGKSSFADYMVIASGRSNRQVVAIAEHLADRLKQAGHGYVPVEGKQTGDWVLVDAGDVVVHIFRPEPRAFYALEKMWALENEAAGQAQAGQDGPPAPRQEAGVKLRSPVSAAPAADPNAISTTTTPAASAGRSRCASSRKSASCRRPQMILREGELLLEAVPAKAVLVALDRRGKVWTARPLPTGWRAGVTIPCQTWPS